MSDLPGVRETILCGFPGEKPAKSHRLRPIRRDILRSRASGPGLTVSALGDTLWCQHATPNCNMGGGGGRGGQMPPFYVDKHDFSKNRRRGPKAPVNPPNPPRSVRKPIEPHFSTIPGTSGARIGVPKFFPGTSGARIGVPKFCATVWYRLVQCHCVGGWKRKCPNTPHLRVAMHVACQPRHPVGVRRYVGGISQVFDEFWLVYVPPCHHAPGGCL